MHRLPGPPRHIQFTLSGWTAIAGALAIFAAVTVAITFLAIGLFVFLLPVLLVAPVLYYFRPKPKPTPITDDVMPEGLKNGPTIIEGEFQVVGPREADDRSPPASPPNL
jgi:hypothetical protein